MKTGSTVLRSVLAIKFHELKHLVWFILTHNITMFMGIQKTLEYIHEDCHDSWQVLTEYFLNKFPSGLAVQI